MRVNYLRLHGWKSRNKPDSIYNQRSTVPVVTEE